MSDKSPQDMIFIKWGSLEAGAKGRWAVTALILMITAYPAGKALGLW